MKKVADKSHLIYLIGTIVLSVFTFQGISILYAQGYKMSTSLIVVFILISLMLLNAIIEIGEVVHRRFKDGVEGVNIKSLIFSNQDMVITLISEVLFICAVICNLLCN